MSGIGVIVVALGVVWWLIVRPLRKAALADRFEASLQRALEMADHETDVLEVVRRSLEETSGELETELLLADSSRAHLSRVVAVGPRGGPACPVETPARCPAVRGVRALEFPRSEALDACPYLRGRDAGPCSAICIPMTVLGRSVGVLHATGADQELPSGAVRAALEGVAKHAGTRLGVVRAMSQSQLQAAMDPLTGLLNRRSLDDRAQLLSLAGTPFSVAIADLDHFKHLNDTFGHETGDRALRLFARVLKTSLRDDDIVARYGGEEFVAVFPGSYAGEAGQFLKRVREGLARTLDEAVMPRFTVSAGIADTSFDPWFEGVLRAADEALSRAKNTGRDRIVVAGSFTSASEDEREPQRDGLRAGAVGSALAPRGA